MGFEQSKFNKPAGEKTPSNKRRNIFGKLTNLAALSAALVGGELKAKDATRTHLDNTEPVATKNESRLADAKKIEEIKKSLVSQR